MVSNADTVIVEQSPNVVNGFWENKTDGLIIVETAGKRIGCITSGDPGCEAEAELYRKRCAELECDIVVAATRSRYISGSIYEQTFLYSKKYNATCIEVSPFIVYNNSSSTSDAEYSIAADSCAKGLYNIILNF